METHTDIKIGVAMTAHNRISVLNKCYSEWKKLMPKNAIFILIDDASDTPIPYADFRFEENVGIPKAKNKCIELLEAKGVTDFFLIDSDIYPTKDNWHLQYINSGLNHAMLCFDKLSNGEQNGNRLIKKTPKYNVFNNPCGVLLYYKKICLDTVGGMDEGFGLGFHEHVQHSLRIYNCGLTPYPYIDVPNSLDYFYSYDYHRAIERTFSYSQRVELIKKNTPKFNKDKFSKAFIPFKQMNNIVITTYFTSIKDPQCNENWECNPDDLSALIESLKGEKLVVLHDCLDILDTENITYIKVKPTGNPYFARWEHILKHLKEHEYDFVFCVDATDVQMLKSPFDKMTGFNLYTGDEPCIINNQWLKTHHNTPLFTSFIYSHAGKQLLNAGLLGGKREIVIKFLEGLVQLNKTETNVLGDMAAFNYIAYTYFRDILMHGRIVNTIFKQYKSNTISWFKHK